MFSDITPSVTKTYTRHFFECAAENRVGYNGISRSCNKTHYSALTQHKFGNHCLANKSKSKNNQKKAYREQHTHVYKFCSRKNDDGSRQGISIVSFVGTAVLFYCTYDIGYGLFALKGKFSARLV